MNSEFINFEINIYRVSQNSFFSHLFLFKSKNQIKISSILLLLLISVRDFLFSTILLCYEREDISRESKVPFTFSPE